MTLIIIAGGDEAGRGSVLGPLTVSVVSIKKSKESKLAKIGVRDSKLLTKRKRNFLFDEIYSLAEEVKVYKITNEEINKAMAAKISLNELEAINFARLIDLIENKPSKIFLDSPDVISEKFGVRISLFSKNILRVKGITAKNKSDSVQKEKDIITVIAEHKADIKYPVVSSASIIAKVVRDEEIEKIADKVGLDIGSGYPSDKKTIDVIRANLDNDIITPYIRNRWKTLQLIRQLKISDFF